MLTRALDGLYRGAGALAGVFLVAIAVIVTAQIGARFVDASVPSSDEFAGFCLAATSFLGLAYAFRCGSHIRVTLFVQGARGRARQALLILALAIGAAMSVLFAWHTVVMVAQNYVRGEVTSGLVPLPLWLPQLGMAVGAVLFALAITEDLVRAVLGVPPVFAASEADPAAGDPHDAG
ncbi:TRAP transporter small permease [Acuticoccus sp.]|uniref:TRAP transporter small permease n=1 Tax=Acuticoccus sp. TaxID=1904378 RepID=UPI003B52733E